MRSYSILFASLILLVGCNHEHDLPEGYDGKKIPLEKFQETGQGWQQCVISSKMLNSRVQACFADPKNDFERCALEVVKDLKPTDVRRLLEDNGTPEQKQQALDCKKQHVK